jgi:hypothetical protein
VALGKKPITISPGRFLMFSTLTQASVAKTDDTVNRSNNTILLITKAFFLILYLLLIASNLFTGFAFNETA